MTTGHHFGFALLAPLAALVCVACTPDGGGDDTAVTDGGSDTDTDTDTDADTDTDTDTDTDPGPPTLTIQLTEFLSGKRIESAAVDLGGDIQTTDSAGEVVYELVPGDLYEATTTPSGFGPIRVAGRVGKGSHTDGGLVPSQDTLDLLSSLFGVNLTEDAGIVAFLVYSGTPESRANLGGVTVAIEEASDLVLVQDNTDARGLSEGDTTIGGQVSTVLFVNVPVGTATPTITPPSGVTCTTEPATVNVDGGGYSSARYYCTE